jgi:hypothetical protein
MKKRTGTLFPKFSQKDTSRNGVPELIPGGIDIINHSLPLSDRICGQYAFRNLLLFTKESTE